jgi:hypothetical protein
MPTFALDLPFAEQVEFFRQKKNLPSQRWDDLLHAAHDRSFVVAGATTADLLDDLNKAVEKGIAQGTDIEAFRKDFYSIVGRRGWHGWTGEDSESGREWRTRVIFETNLAASYAAGRHAQLTDPELLRRLPCWRYAHDDSVLNPRKQHQAWNGLTLRHDHPFWQIHYPPNGWGCHCYVEAVEAPAAGDPTEPPPGWDAPDENGKFPGIDRGWAYAPGKSVADDLRRIVAEKAAKLPAPIGADFGAACPDIGAGFGEFFDAALENRARPQGRIMVVGTMKPAWVKAATQAGFAPGTAEMAIRDNDIAHFFRDAKKNRLPVKWFRELPTHLKQPQAVLLDTTHTNEPALLLVYDATGNAKKLVVRVNYRIRKAGTMNLVESGRVLDSTNVDSIRGQVGKGYALVEGSL